MYTHVWRARSPPPRPGRWRPRPSRGLGDVWPERRAAALDCLRPQPLARSGCTSGRSPASLARAAAFELPFTVGSPVCTPVASSLGSDVRWELTHSVVLHDVDRGLRGIMQALPTSSVRPSRHHAVVVGQKRHIRRASRCRRHVLRRLLAVELVVWPRL